VVKVLGDPTLRAGRSTAVPTGVMTAAAAAGLRHGTIDPGTAGRGRPGIGAGGHRFRGHGGFDRRSPLRRHLGCGRCGQRTEQRDDEPARQDGPQPHAACLAERIGQLFVPHRPLHRRLRVHRAGGHVAARSRAAVTTGTNRLIRNIVSPPENLS